MKRPIDFYEMKAVKEKITMITAYDYPSAKAVASANADIILVGDSLGMVVLGYDSTVAVTVSDMIHHSKAVKRGAPDTFVVVDMPFMSYHGSIDKTLENATQLYQETGASAVKLEGAGSVIEKIRLLTEGGIPVVAHLGLTPQSVGITGSYKVRAKGLEEAEALIADAKAVQAAGAIMLVLEAIPRQLAERVTKELSIPTIGIGAGKETDGQVLVFHDMVSYGVSRTPKFVKVYGDADGVIIPSLSQFVSEVKTGAFPDVAHSFTMDEEDIRALYGGEK